MVTMRRRVSMRKCNISTSSRKSSSQEINVGIVLELELCLYLELR